MKVVCESRKRSDVRESECQVYISETAYELRIGQEYTVYGQYLARGCLLYLIDPYAPNDLSRPFWYPASLFSIKNHKIPSLWKFSYHPQLGFSGRVTAVWGYEELATSGEHFSGLLEREEEAIVTFVRRKAEIDAEEQV